MLAGNILAFRWRGGQILMSLRPTWSSLHKEFQASQGYLVRRCLKTKQSCKRSKAQLSTARTVRTEAAAGQQEFFPSVRAAHWTEKSYSQACGKPGSWRKPVASLELIKTWANMESSTYILTLPKMKLMVQKVVYRNQPHLNQNPRPHRQTPHPPYSPKLTKKINY